MKTCLAVSVIALLIGFVAAAKIDSEIPCAETANCTNIPTLPSETVCQEGYCMCPSDKGFVKCSVVQASIHEMRTPGPLVYRICKLDKDCNLPGGHCNTTNQQCDCSKDYVPSSDKHHCLPKAKSINSNCTEDNQCLAFLANTTCLSNNCVCVSGYHYVNSTCWRMAGYEQPCTKNQECSHIKGAICTDMKCVCDAETVLSEDGKRCLVAVRDIGDECMESVQCETFEHSLCVEKMCQCQKDYHYEQNMTRCFLNKEIGSECATDYDCYQAEDYKSDPPKKSLICEANVCKCAENLVSVANVCVNSGPPLLASFPVIALITVICVTANYVLL